MSDRRLLESVADAVAAGEAVEWADVERATAKSRDADLLRQLRVVSAIGAARSSIKLPPGPNWWIRTTEAGVAAVLCVAAVQFALGMLGAPAALVHVTWPHILSAFVFGAGGVLLLAGGGSDRRLRLLGGWFLTISSAFALAWMPPPEAGWAGAVATAVRPLLPDAFLALMIWRFVREFPTPTEPRAARRIADIFVEISFGVGVALFTVNALGRFGTSTMPAWFMTFFELFERERPAGVYWPLLFAIGAPAIPFLLWKARLVAYEDRRRVTLFVGALAAGLMPFLLAVIAAPFVSGLQGGALQQRVGVLLYASLASIVPVAAYSVAVDRVMDLQFLIRATLKYALARYAVWGMSLAPIAYVGYDVQANQQLTIAEYLERSRPVGPLALSAVGLIALTVREHMLRALDRWFQGEPIDQPQSLARLERRCRMAGSLRGVTAALAAELRQALHASSVSVLLVNDDGTVLVPVEGPTGPIRSDSMLLEILRSTRADVPLGSRALASIARLLSPADRKWLRDADPQVLSLLVGSTEMLLGVVAIGEARTGLPYSTAHLTLVTAACGRAALEIENRRLGVRAAAESALGGPPAGQGIEWREEPATYCPACALVWSPDTRNCSCGTATKVAALPWFIQGKFRLERLVGSGGMGVVYLAVDMVLGRQVAIKTLPPLRTASAERLHREARTMARVLHPNLALIYGTEQWRGTPMLIVEYLQGGTLRDWLRRGPVSFLEAIDLGIVLADVLDRVHEAGVLHRDVKPSNIGFTVDNQPKLLDFGLALLDGTAGQQPTDMRLPARARSEVVRTADPESTVTVADRLVGTPLYLAPEALAGVTPQPSFDLWGLALVIYEAIAGRHPFAAPDVEAVLDAAARGGIPDIRDYRSTCPPGLAAFLRDSLSPIVTGRPESASAMRNALRRLRATIPEHAH